MSTTLEAMHDRFFLSRGIRSLWRSGYDSVRKAALWHEAPHQAAATPAAANTAVGHYFERGDVWREEFWRYIKPAALLHARTSAL